MRILQLCKKFPFPLKDGESIAVTYLSKALNDLGHEVTLLSMNTSKHYTDVKALPKAFDHYQGIHVTELDNSIRVKDALLNLFSKDSYHVSRFICEDFRAKLIHLLETQHFDVVQLETLYLAPYVDVIKEHSSAIVSMRSHNVEFEIWDRITENTTFYPKKWYLRHLTNKLKQYEIDHLNDYDYLVSVSERDLKKFKELGFKNGAMASPIGLEIDNYVNVDRQRTTDEISSLKLGFIGAMDWMPNMEGLQWFLDQVWSQLQRQMPDIELHIAGRHTPQELLDLDLPGVTVHGEVPDAVAFTNQNDVMIVPLFSGSGMRVKILEAMALGKVIVTTSLGAEGIHAEDGHHLLIAEDTEAFVQQILKVHQNPKIIKKVGAAAREFVEEHYDHRAIAAKLVSKYQELIDQHYGSLSVTTYS